MMTASETNAKMAPPVLTVICHISVFVKRGSQVRSTFGPAAEKRDLRSYTNSEDQEQPAHPRSLVWISAVRLHNIGTLLKI